jgi:hypothetical protein
MPAHAARAKRVKKAKDAGFMLALLASDLPSFPTSIEIGLVRT